jgi:SOS-response transcriptional repressor LexA
MQMRNRRELGYRGFQVLAYVRETIASEGMAPSYAMIANELGLPDRTDVCRIVRRLEKRGVLSRVGHGRVRRLRLSGPAFHE